MSGNYLCLHVEDGKECRRKFDTLKQLNTHAKSHRKRPCRWCERDFSENGHTQHEQNCSEKPESIPWRAWAGLLDDLIAHTADVPTGSVCLLSTTRGAVFMERAAALRAVMTAEEATVVIPTGLLNRPEKAARDRRKDLNVDQHPGFDGPRVPTPKAARGGLPVAWDQIL